MRTLLASNRWAYHDTCMWNICVNRGSMGTLYKKHVLQAHYENYVEETNRETLAYLCTYA